MKKPEKVAAELLDELGIDWQGTGSQKVGEMERRDAIASVAAALRAARNEGRDEREREIFGDEPLMMAESLDTLADVLVGAAHPTAKVFRELAAAIRFKKDSGNG